MQLSSREKRLLQLLAGVVGILVLYYGIIGPVMSLRESIDSTYQTSISRLNDLDTIYRQYREIREKKERFNQQLRDTRGVSALVEENAQKAGILGNKTYNRDHETNLQNRFKKISTDVKFEGVNIKSAVDFLYYMENSNKLIKISSLRISQALKERSNYDVTVTFDSYKNQ